MNRLFSSRTNLFLLSFLALSILLRTLFLGNIPGINGDEALLGIRAVEGLNLSVRTNSGNFQNVFYLLPLIWIQSLFSPSVWVLRSVSLLSGLAVIILGWFLIKKAFNENAALAFVMITASMPILVAYSRFGWEPSQTPLIALLLLYFSIQRKWGSVLIVQAIALVVHPTNTFLFLIPLNLFLLDAQSKLNWPPKIRVWSLVLLALFAFWVLYALSVRERVDFMVNWLSEHDLAQFASTLDTVKHQQIAGRFASITGWRDMSLLFSELISGVTI